MVGGLAKTVNYKGNRIDIGGHRFFSKSTRVMDWWARILPLQRLGDADEQAGAWLSGSASAAKAAKRPRPGEDRARDAAARAALADPVSAPHVRLPGESQRDDGPQPRSAADGADRRAATHARASAPIRNEVLARGFHGQPFRARALRDVLRGLHREGLGCARRSEIKADWGAQRIKGLSISQRARARRSRGAACRSRTRGDIYQRETETSLIERFLYPKRGPGQLWEEVTRRDRRARRPGDPATTRDSAATPMATGSSRRAFATARARSQRVEGDYFFSTIPIRELIAGLDAEVPTEVRDVAGGLEYRDFITVGVLLRARGDLARACPTTGSTCRSRTSRSAGCRSSTTGAPTWSPIRARSGSGWSTSPTRATRCGRCGDEEFAQFAIDELCQLGLVERDDVLDTRRAARAQGLSRLLRQLRAVSARFASTSTASRTCS